MDSSETTPRRKDAQRNREAILCAAKELFATSADVPMYEIARAAGIGQGTLYRHFADRRSIAIALFDEELNGLEELATELSDDPDAVFVLMRRVAELQVHFQALVEAVHVDSPDDDPAKEPHSVRLLEIFAEPFQRAQAAGSLRSDVTLDDVSLVVKMVDGALRHDPDRADHAATAARALSIVIDGLRR
jgi:AcrR family transcriptional regulator